MSEEVKTEEVKEKKAKTKKDPWTIRRRFDECDLLMKKPALLDDEAKKIESHLAAIQEGINAEQKKHGELKAQLGKKPRISKVDKKLLKRAARKLVELSAEQIQKILNGEI